MPQSNLAKLRKVSDIVLFLVDGVLFSGASLLEQFLSTLGKFWTLQKAINQVFRLESTENYRGPRIDACGTPDVNAFNFDRPYQSDQTVLFNHFKDWMDQGAAGCHISYKEEIVKLLNNLKIYNGSSVL